MPLPFVADLPHLPHNPPHLPVAKISLPKLAWPPGLFFPIGSWVKGPRIRTFCWAVNIYLFETNKKQQHDLMKLAKGRERDWQKKYQVYRGSSKKETLDIRCTFLLKRQIAVLELVWVTCKKEGATTQSLEPRKTTAFPRNQKVASWGYQPGGTTFFTAKCDITKAQILV